MFINNSVVYVSHPYAESRKRARKKWRKSEKGRAWDKAYYQRPEVKARNHEKYIKSLIRSITYE